MPRVTYAAETKAALMRAVTTARKSGKSWKDAHEAAVAVGYKGSLQGIVKLMRSMSGGKRKPGRKPGRPAGRKNGVKLAPNGTDISTLIDSLVDARINAALDKAIQVLRSARH
jgi:hypothetical protein